MQNVWVKWRKVVSRKTIQNTGTKECQGKENYISIIKNNYLHSVQLYMSISVYTTRADAYKRVQACLQAVCVYFIRKEKRKQKKAL